MHAACIWLVHLGTLFSAYFILAANSWMQHPVGYAYNPDTGRAEMNDFAAVLFNKVQLVTFPHVVLSAYMTGAAFVVGVAFWHLVRRATSERGPRPVPQGGPHRRRAARWSPASAWPSRGDIQGKIMTEVQPMKMAAAEGLYDTETSARFSLLTIGSLDGSEEKFAIKIPGPALVPRHRLDRRQGQGHQRPARRSTSRSTARTRARRTTRPATTRRSSRVTYWTFRLMIGLGLLAAPARRLDPVGHPPGPPPTGRLVLLGWRSLLPFLPLFANSFGWIFTEMGRQPWAVFGLMTTAQAVSPGSAPPRC